MRQPVSVAVALLVLVPALLATADDLVVNGAEMVIDTDTQVDGSVFVENGGTLTIRNCTLTLILDFDEEHHVDVAGSSRLVIDNAQIDSVGGQFWFELYGDDTNSPEMVVSGADTWLTNHSGIRPFDATQITVTGGDVEELQVRDQVTVELSNAAAYPVYFFDGVTTTIDRLDTGTDITNTVSVPGAWSMQLSNAWVEGYQIDLMNGASVTLSDGDGIVLSMHTPGDLGPDIQIVEGVTSEVPISGSVTNLGTEFHFTDCNIALFNLYVFGTDRVLLRGMHVNEVNAEANSELIIGQQGYQTVLNCNLCQVYDHATFTVEHAVIDGSENVPSATSSYHDFAELGQGVMTFREMDLRDLFLTVREAGTMLLHNCTYDSAKLSILDTTATFTEHTLAVDFSASPTTGPAPLEVTFADMSTGDVVGYSWDFGDGSSATDRNPVHTYQQHGSYTVSLTATGPAGSNTASRADYVVVTQEQPPVTCDGTPVLVAAAAHVGGAGGSVWRSDLAVFNASDGGTELALRFLPSDTDNAASACVDGGTVAGWASTLFEDVVGSTFGQDSSVGALAVYAPHEDVVVMSRTYNQAASGTFGQTIPGRTADEAIPDGDVGVLVQLHENAGYRTNIGFLNTSASAATVTVELYAEDGAFLGSRDITLRPYEHTQINRIFTTVTSGSVTNGRAEVSVTGGPVLTYASVVDNGTSDPSYIEPG